MKTTGGYDVLPIGRVHSELSQRHQAPKQGSEGAPDARLEIFPKFVAGLEGITVGSTIIVLTWLHEAQRDVLRVHPRDDETRPQTGVFATRSSDRPNPVGLHRVAVLQVEPTGWLHVQGLEAINKTPVIDIKPVLHRLNDS
ncbi:MAG: tRNA (N6-threonylcarbamoyladenosine(37)-N6)-methyltransferase TrmO [Luteitalea sp.]|nr:tRNA (N6-threonylcarbamoyladenosine(37)-N6)-methyltransferase TrmO [Luteitalea sp.]